MLKLTLLILFIITLCIPTSGHAQQAKSVSIAPCLPVNPALIRAEYAGDAFSQASAEVVRDIPAFYALEGQYIEWLGYAPKGQEHKEWQGVEYGFGGVDMREYGEGFLIAFYSDAPTFSKREIIGRIEVREYAIDDTYLLFVTTLKPYGLPDGSRYDYHVPADPRRNGEACMFRVNADDFRRALGWQE